jgi:predicted permease
LSLLTGVLFGIVPAFLATRTELAQQLRNGRARGVSRWNRLASRDMLVSLEIALAVVLLAGSGLMMRSLGKLLAISPGFQTENVLTLRLNSPEGTKRDSMPAFYSTITDRLASLPSVTAVTLQDCPPLSGGCNGTAMWRNDRPRRPAGEDAMTGVHWITPNWPTVMDVPLKSGRLFDSGDRAGNRKAVLLSETAAKNLYPNEDPLGKPIGVGQGGFDSAYVAGVIADVRYNTIDSMPGADVYVPLAQSPRGRMMILLHTAGNPEAVVPAVRAALRELAPDIPLYDVRTMSSRVGDSTAFVRFGTILLVLFGVVALALATIGAYGVISYSVSQRTREIGIRMALGASARGVVRMVVRQGMTMAIVGGIAGVVFALGTSGVLKSMLYGIEPADPVTFVGIIAVLLTAVAMASWIPARRAADIQPTEALREE